MSNRSYGSLLLVLTAAVLTHPALAQTSPSSDAPQLVSPAYVMDASSSSAAASLPSAPLAAAPATDDPVPVRETATRPFSAVGVDVKIGAGGIGLDVATPLARKFNLRATGYFFRYNVTLTEDYVTYGGNLQLASGGLSLDWYPFNGSFRLTGGVIAYNGNEITGSATLNPNQSFTLNGTTYTSSATDPLHATGTLYLGAKAAPTFSFGWGNIVPRKINKHFSVPVEIGFAYVGYPHVDLGFVGVACNEFGTACQDVSSNPTFQQDLAAQKNKYRDDLSALRFYPLLSIGFGYRF